MLPDFLVEAFKRIGQANTYRNLIFALLLLLLKCMEVILKQGLKTLYHTIFEWCQICY